MPDAFVHAHASGVTHLRSFRARLHFDAMAMFPVSLSDDEMLTSPPNVERKVMRNFLAVTVARQRAEDAAMKRMAAAKSEAAEKLARQLRGKVAAATAKTDDTAPELKSKERVEIEVMAAEFQGRVASKIESMAAAAHPAVGVSPVFP